MRRALALCLLLTTSALAYAQPSQLEALGLAAYTNEDVVLPAAGTVKTLTSAKATDQNVLFVTVAMDGGQVRWTRTGQAPSATYGNLALDQAVILLSVTEAQTTSFSMMSPGGIAVTAHVEYYAPVGTTPIP